MPIEYTVNSILPDVFGAARSGSFDCVSCPACLAASKAALISDGCRPTVCRVFPPRRARNTERTSDTATANKPSASSPAPKYSGLGRPPLCQSAAKRSNQTASPVHNPAAAKFTACRHAGKISGFGACSLDKSATVSSGARISVLMTGRLAKPMVRAIWLWISSNLCRESLYGRKFSSNTKSFCPSADSSHKRP